jgi:hypothetical protein
LPAVSDAFDPFGGPALKVYINTKVKNGRKICPGVRTP